MKELKFKLYEIVTLDVELNGIKNPQTGEIILNGVLGLKLPLVAKYWITELANIVNAEKNGVEKMRNELVTTYGTTGEDKKVILEMYLDPTAETKVLSPKYEEFIQKFNELLQEEKTISFTPIKLSLLGTTLEDDNNYPYFFKCIDPTA